jgi:hypothetical protein
MICLEQRIVDGFTGGTVPEEKVDIEHFKDSWEVVKISVDISEDAMFILKHADSQTNEDTMKSSSQNRVLMMNSTTFRTRAGL